MKMLREVHRTVEPTLEAVVQWCDTQHKVLGNCVNDLGDMTVQLSKQLKKTNKRLNRIRIGAQLTNFGCLGVAVISLIHTCKLWDLEQQVSTLHDEVHGVEASKTTDAQKRAARDEKSG